MSESPIVISFFSKSKVRNTFPKEKVLRAWDAFLKCDAYDLYLPILSDAKNALNLFEETVLRLSALHTVNVENVQDQLCLEHDFVHVILEHLQHMEYIDTSGHITENGSAYLIKNRGSGEGEKKSHKKHYQLLVLKQTGEILSQLIPAGSQNQLRTNLEGAWMTIQSGSRGKLVETSGYTWWPKKGEASVRRNIRREEIIRLVQKQNLRDPLNMLCLDTSDAIDIAKKPSEVYLHVKLILQRGLVGSVIVSDGLSFVNGVATKYALENQTQAIEKLRESFNQNIKIEKKSEIIFKHYYEVHRSMELEQVPDGDDMDTREERRQIRSRNLVRMHGALEWACVHFLRQWPVEPGRLRSLNVGKRGQNQKILRRMAVSLGFRLREETEKLLGYLDDMSLSQYRNSDVPNLHVLLPLVIAAGKDHPDSTLRQVADEMPYVFRLFKRLNDTKMLRHGNEQVKDDFEDYDSIRIELVKFFSLFLPGYIDEDVNEQIVVQDDASIIRLHAEENLSQLLGREIYERCGSRLQADLRTLALTADRGNEMETCDFILCLAKVMEYYLRMRAREISYFQRRQKSDLLEYLTSVVSEKEAGYKLPIELSTVRDFYIDDAVKHRDGTLGAYTLVYFGNLTKTQLEAMEIRSMLDTIAETLRYRKHANDVGLCLSKEKMDRMRENTFNFIKALEKY